MISTSVKVSVRTGFFEGTSPPPREDSLSCEEDEALSRFPKKLVIDGAPNLGILTAFEGDGLYFFETLVSDDLAEPVEEIVADRRGDCWTGDVDDE